MVNNHENNTASTNAAAAYKLQIQQPQLISKSTPALANHSNGSRPGNVAPHRVSVSFHPMTLEKSASTTLPGITRARSASASHFPTVANLLQLHTEFPAIKYSPNGSRTHSNSVSSLDSVDSATLSNLVQLDTSNVSHYPATDNYNKYGKIKLMEDIDIEKQLIISAGGKKEDVFCFVMKLLLLTVIVLGSGVLIFYAL